MDMSMVASYAAIGLVTGIASGMFGIGAGSIRIPLLLFTGMPLLNAFATNMVAIPFSTLVGAYMHRAKIQWDIVKSFTTGGLCGIILATYLVGVAPSSVLALVFLLAAVLTAIGLYLDKISATVYDRLRPTPHNLFIGAFFGNVLIGMRGGSGGTLFPPILRSMHVRMHCAIATSLVASFFCSLVALSGYIYRGDALIAPGLILSATAMAGSYIGSIIAINTEGRWLKMGLSMLVLTLACYVVYSEFA
jgi:hypothetical protein